MIITSDMSGYFSGFITNYLNSTKNLSISPEKKENSLNLENELKLSGEKLNKNSDTVNIFQAHDWSNPQVKEDYAEFVKMRWEELKTENIEVDCKGLALKFLSDFTKHYEETKGIDLPYPGNGRIKDKWTTLTNENNKGLASKIIRTRRPDYAKIRKKNPDQQIIFGTNYFFRGGANANTVSTKMIEEIKSRDPDGKPIVQNHPRNMSKKEREVTPEVDIQQLRAGDLVCLDHAGDGRWDHVVNVIDVEKDANGKVKVITMGVGSFDDMRDQKSSTSPGFRELNLYTEEVKVHFDEKGKATKSEVTWSSEPTEVFGKRYNVTKTLMELRYGGKIKVGVWK